MDFHSFKWETKFWWKISLCGTNVWKTSNTQCCQGKLGVLQYWSFLGFSYIIPMFELFRVYPILFKLMMCSNVIFLLLLWRLVKGIHITCITMMKLGTSWKIWVKWTSCNIVMMSYIMARLLNPHLGSNMLHSNFGLHLHAI